MAHFSAWLDWDHCYASTWTWCAYAWATIHRHEKICKCNCRQLFDSSSILWHISASNSLIPSPIIIVPAVLDNKPFALYGHSLGGWICRELILELKRRGSRLPELFFCAGSSEPYYVKSRPMRRKPVKDMSYDDFVAYLRYVTILILCEHARINFIATK